MSLKKIISNSIRLFLIYFFLRIIVQLIIRVGFDVYGFNSLGDGYKINTIFLSLKINLISELPVIFAFFFIFITIQIAHLNVIKLKLRNQFFIAIVLVLFLSYIFDLRDFKYLLDIFKLPFQKVLEIQLATGFQFLTILIFVFVYVKLQFPYLKGYSIDKEK